MQYATKITDTETQKQADVHELLTILTESANPNRTVQLAAALIKKIVAARLTPEELAQVKGKAQEIKARRSV